MTTADEALREAVAAACHEEAVNDGTIQTDMILSEFVVVAARQGWDDEGESVTQVCVMPMDGPAHRILGLLHAAVLRFESD